MERKTSLEKNKAAKLSRTEFAKVWPVQCVMGLISFYCKVPLEISTSDHSSFSVAILSHQNDRVKAQAHGLNWKSTEVRKTIRHPEYNIQFVCLWGLSGVINDPLSSQTAYLTAFGTQCRVPSKEHCLATALCVLLNRVCVVLHFSEHLQRYFKPHFKWGFWIRAWSLQCRRMGHKLEQFSLSLSLIGHWFSTV